jgi:hypothetical protein
MTVSIKAMTAVEGSLIKETFEEDICPHDGIMINREYDVFKWMHMYLQSDCKVVPKLT